MASVLIEWDLQNGTLGSPEMYALGPETAWRVAGSEETALRARGRNKHCALLSCSRHATYSSCFPLAGF